jgi:hypothetical protein
MPFSRDQAFRLQPDTEDWPPLDRVCMAVSLDQCGCMKSPVFGMPWGTTAAR